MTVEPNADDAPAASAAAPLRTADDATIASLRLSLVDDEAPLAARYRALFSLRNLAGDKAEQALIEGEREWRGREAKLESFSKSTASKNSTSSTLKKN